MSIPSSKAEQEFTRRSDTESICMCCYATMRVSQPEDLANEERDLSPEARCAVPPTPLSCVWQLLSSDSDFVLEASQCRSANRCVDGLRQLPGVMAAASIAMVRKRKKTSPVIERDPNPFMRVGGPFVGDLLPVSERRYLDLADIALGRKPPERPHRNQGKNSRTP